MRGIRGKTGICRKLVSLLLCGAIVIVLAAGDAEAAKRKKQNKRSAAKTSAVFSRAKYAAFVVDADTGRVLHSDQADETRYPASLTKMMTAYLTFESLAERRIGFNQEVRVSEEAASQSALNIHLKTGDRITIDEALSCLIVRSANDTAVVLAEAIAGSEDAFARRMTAKARELGMSRTRFMNASGLPDEDQVTTARDMATLGLALRRDFPTYYQYFKREYCSYDGQTYKSHNRVTMYYDGADGIKTGYIRTSGYNLVTSASKNGMHLVGVVMGGPTASMRDEKMVSLLNGYFAQGSGSGAAQVAESTAAAKSKEVAINNIIDQAQDEASGEGDEAAEESGGTEVVATNESAVQEAGQQAAPVAAKTEAQQEIRMPSKQVVAEEKTPEKKIWGIQIGAYNDAKQAMAAATKASKMAGSVVAGSKIKVASEGRSKQSIHRARVVNLTFAQASKACRVINENNSSCFVGKFGRL